MHTVDSIGSWLRNITILLLLLLLLLVLLSLQLPLLALVHQLLLLILVDLTYLRLLLVLYHFVLSRNSLKDAGNSQVFRIVRSKTLLFHLPILLLRYQHTVETKGG